ncbi:hypothetical protein [Corynebacterium sanguinis]|uniref:hypothetical protein n=1 Tax=Corynebacterium sanguinis TaxID=2594913 RepID=UPI0021A8C069|nr:hypothetical protein [Corynebacterium sanguinis]MCT1411688.1 hypothetical protein [Corynebacterium sanguinis]
MNWEMIANMNVHGDPVLSEMQEGIREALAAGEDPGVAVAFAMVREVTNRENAESDIKQVATYVLDLERRLVEAKVRMSKLRFAEAEGRILGS